MDLKLDKSQAALRLALCGGGAALLYAGALKLPALEQRRAWLEEHRVEAIAGGAAVLFGLSLVLAPPEPGAAAESEPELEGYEPVG